MKLRKYRKDGTYRGYDIEKTDYYCPKCGKQEVYEETGILLLKTYFLSISIRGTVLYCKSCKYSFTMSGRVVDTECEWVDD